MATEVCALLERASTGDEYVALAACGIPRSTLRQWTKQGRIAPVKVGREKRVRRSELAAAIASLRAEAKPCASSHTRDAKSAYLALVAGGAK